MLTKDASYANPPTFETVRLTIRPMRLADAPAYFRLRSDPEAARLIPRVPDASLDQTENTLERILAEVRTGRAMGWTALMRKDGAFVGVVGIHHLELGCRSAQVAYELDRAHWGMGLMSEAIGPIVDFAFEKLGLHRLEAHINPQNVRSLRLAEKAGFAHEGVLRENELVDGQFFDTAIYGRLSTR